MWVEDPDGVRIVLVEVPAATRCAATRASHAKQPTAAPFMSVTSRLGPAARDGMRKSTRPASEPGHRGRPGRDAGVSTARRPGRRRCWRRCGLPPCCPCGRPAGGSGGREAEDRHVAVDGLVLAGPDPERLVPDPDLAGVPDGAVEPPPRSQAGSPHPGEAVQGVEVAQYWTKIVVRPNHCWKPRQPSSGCPAQYLQHLGHGRGDQQPLKDPQRVVEARPIKKTTKSPSMLAV